MASTITIDLRHVARGLGIPLRQVQAVVELLDDGNTVPFITRYRKDQTGALDEEQIRQVQARLTKLRLLADRKQTILRSIESQGKLTEPLARQIQSAGTGKRLEDLYLPYKPRKQTLATLARSRGLEPLAKEILEADPVCADLDGRAADFVSTDRQVPTPADALLGAGHLLAEQFSEQAELRGQLREILHRTGKFVSTRVGGDQKDQPQKPETSQNSRASGSASPRSEAETPEKSSQKPAEASETSNNSGQTAPEATQPPKNSGQTAPEATQTPENSGEAAAEATQTPENSGQATAEATQTPENSVEATAETTLSPEAPPTVSPEKPVAAAGEAKPRAAKAKPRLSKRELKKKQAEEKKIKAYRDYFDYTEEIRKIPPHRILALNRGERARGLRVKIEADLQAMHNLLDELLVPPEHPHGEYLRGCARDALSRLILPGLEREIRRELTDRAEAHAVGVFARNLRNLLLQPPVCDRRVLAVDPGFKSGCKLAALDQFGNVLEHGVIFLVGRTARRNFRVMIEAWRALAS